MTPHTLTTGFVSAMLLIGSSVLAAKGQQAPVFTKMWTHGHTTPEQVSEIPAFDKRTRTVWVTGVVGVDVLDAATGALVEHIDVAPHGFVNSIAIHKGLAALAVEAAPDRRAPGRVLFYDTRTRRPADGVAEVRVGSLPDMLTFTHDGGKLLVANEGTPNAAADEHYTTPDPAGSVTIIDMTTRTALATPGLAGVPVHGDHLRTNTGFDMEPEYIAVTKDDARAYVTLQEANAVGELDLTTNTFTRVFALGAKDFSMPGNEIDPNDDESVSFVPAMAKGLYQPDGVATYKWNGRPFIVLANEGEFREDDMDRSAAADFGAATPLPRLRVSKVDSSADDLYAVGARSFSIRDGDGEIVYDSGSLLDREAAARGLYDDRRSRDKGVEPESVALIKARGRTYAFVGLERTISSAVAVFDVTSPYHVRFLDMIVTPGDRAPEGLLAFRDRGELYLVIANERPVAQGGTSNTTLYQMNLGKAEK